MVLGNSLNQWFTLINLSRAAMLLLVVCQAADEHITKHPHSQRVTEGSTVTLACEFSRPIQFTFDERIIWYKNHKAISYNDRVTATENRFLSVIVSKNNKRFDLHISHFSSNDTGEYFCYFTLSSGNNPQSKSANLVVGSGDTTTAPASRQHTEPYLTYSATTGKDSDDVINNARPTAVFVSISTTCIVLLAIIVLWIFKGKGTNDNRYVNNLITMPSSCLKRSHDNQEEVGKAPSTTAFDESDGVFVNKNATDMFLISGTTTKSDKRVQNDYHDVTILLPATKDLSAKSSADALYPIPPIPMKDRKRRNVEGLTYAQLDLHKNPKKHISRGMPVTQYAVISLIN